MAQEPLTYDEWVRRAASEEVPPPADGVLHFGERAALVEQLSYLKRRNAKLSRQQRAVLLAACEAQAAHARCADFAGELLSKSGDNEDLDRLTQENAELKRKTAALADYVRRTAPAEEGQVDSDTTSSDSENDDDDDNSSAPSHVQANFSVEDMIADDVPLVAKFLDGYLPDPERLSGDLTDELASVIGSRGIATSLIMNQPDDDNNNDSGSDNEEEELYGVLSLVSFGSSQ